MTPAPANEYERFILMLPEELRKECRERLNGTKLSPDHPVFGVLADVYGRTPAKEEPASPDFLEEAQLHSQLSKQLLADFKELPNLILARLEPQIVGLMDALTGPVATLQAAAAPRTASAPHAGPQAKARRFSTPMSWVIAFSTCLSLAVIVATLLLYFGAQEVSGHYEEAYQQRLSSLQRNYAGDVESLDRLLSAGITVRLERNEEGDGYFLILKGARRAAQPANTPEGLAVEIWP